MKWYAYEIRGEGRHEIGVHLHATNAWMNFIKDVTLVRRDVEITFMRLGTVEASNSKAARQQVQLGNFVDPQVELKGDDWRTIVDEGDWAHVDS